MTKRTMALAVALALVAAAPVAVLANNGNGNDKKEHVSFKTATSVLLTENGTALVRGAEVTAVSDNTITAETDLGGVTLTWTIDTDTDTEFITTNGDDSFDLGDVEDGDTISFSGELDSAFNVDANVVKEWSEPSQNADVSHRVKGWFNKHFSFGFWKN